MHLITNLFYEQEQSLSMNDIYWGPLHPTPKAIHSPERYVLHFLYREVPLAPNSAQTQGEQGGGTSEVFAGLQDVDHSQDNAR